MPVEMSTRVVTRDTRAIELEGIAFCLTRRASSSRAARAQCLDERFTMAIIFESMIAL